MTPSCPETSLLLPHAMDCRMGSCTMLTWVILFHGMSKLEVRQDPQSLGGGKILFAASALGVWLWSQEGSGESSRWRMLFERDRVGVFLFLMTMSHSHRRFQIFFCRLMRVQMSDLPSFATSIGHVVFLQSDHRVCAYWIEIGHWYQPEEVHLYWRWPQSHCFQHTFANHFTVLLWKIPYFCRWHNCPIFNSSGMFQRDCKVNEFAKPCCKSLINSCQSVALATVGMRADKKRSWEQEQIYEIATSFQKCTRSKR